MRSETTSKTQTRKHLFSNFISYMRTFSLFNALYCGCKGAYSGFDFARKEIPLDFALTSLVLFYLGTAIFNTIAITTPVATLKLILLVQSFFFLLGCLDSMNCDYGMLWIVEVSMNIFFKMAYFNTAALVALLMSPAITGLKFLSELCYIGCLIPASIYTGAVLTSTAIEFLCSFADNFSSYRPNKDTEDSQNTASASSSSTFSPAAEPSSESTRSNGNTANSRFNFFPFSFFANKRNCDQAQEFEL